MDFCEKFLYDFCDIPRELFEFVIFTNVEFKDMVRLAMTCKVMHAHISGMKYEKQVAYNTKMKFWFTFKKYKDTIN